MVLLLLLATQGKSGDTEAWQVLQKHAQSLEAAKSVRGEVRSGGGPVAGTKGTFLLAKPNLYAIVLPDVEYHSDGRHAFVYNPKASRYSMNPIEKPVLKTWILPGFEAFFGEAVLTNPRSEKYYDGQNGGVPAVKCNYLEDSPSSGFYLDATTGEPLAHQIRGKQSMYYRSYEKLEWDAKFSASDFKWTPPTGAKKVDDPFRSG